LYAEVAFAELIYAERRGLHADLARALDRLNPDDVLALAPHYRAAAALLDPVRTTKVLTHAVEAAVLSGRNADALLERLRSAGRTAPLADALADRIEALRRKDVTLAWQAAERLAGQGATMLAAQAKVEWAELGGNEPRDVLRDCYTVFQEGDDGWWMDRTRILARAHGLSMGLSRVAGPLTKTGVAGCAAGGRWAVQCRHRGPAVPQPAHSGDPPAQQLREAWPQWPRSPRPMGRRSLNGVMRQAGVHTPGVVDDLGDPQVHHYARES
jgi:hypothetical protein